jgi:menaquinone-9 beta-reductase
MPETPIYDIAVIGGGLAGLCLSLQAAEKGYSVKLFEKENYPFHKVCGEYISLESYDFLRRMGVPLQQWEVPIIKKFQTSDVKGNLYNFELPLGGFGVSRYAYTRN